MGGRGSIPRRLALPTVYGRLSIIGPSTLVVRSHRPIGGFLATRPAALRCRDSGCSRRNFVTMSSTCLDVTDGGIHARNPARFPPSVPMASAMPMCRSSGPRPKRRQEKPDHVPGAQRRPAAVIDLGQPGASHPYRSGSRLIMAPASAAGRVRSDPKRRITP